MPPAQMSAGSGKMLSDDRSALQPFAQAVLCVTEVTLVSWGSPVRQDFPAPQVRMLSL